MPRTLLSTRACVGLEWSTTTVISTCATNHSARVPSLRTKLSLFFTVDLVFVFSFQFRFTCYVLFAPETLPSLGSSAFHGFHSTGGICLMTWVTSIAAVHRCGCPCSRLKAWCDHDRLAALVSPADRTAGLLSYTSRRNCPGAPVK